MTNTAATTSAADTQIDTDVHQLMNIIVSNLAVSGQPMPASGVTRVEAALHNVLSRRDEEVARRDAALEYARRGLVQAELIVSDDYGRGGGSDLPSWDCETATEYLVDAQANMAAALRGEKLVKPIAVQIREACEALGVEYSDCGDGTYLVAGFGRCTLMLLADHVLEGGIKGATGRAETIPVKANPFAPQRDTVPCPDRDETALIDYIARRPGEGELLIWQAEVFELATLRYADGETRDALVLEDEQRGVRLWQVDVSPSPYWVFVERLVDGEWTAGPRFQVVIPGEPRYAPCTPSTPCSSCADAVRLVYSYTPCTGRSNRPLSA
ncbi:hypothetical protein [Saccharothrix xinjiangensis]|uniref:Uncharacterized protein n=2 Tax=Saccharothrix xinjiangensis TaxID=204798 RepID=A0ABV9XUD8_9PSEU